jgi:serine phosphatase RsbU (regulator of sigma subunit)
MSVEALRESLENISQAVLVVGPDLAILFANRPYGEMFELDPEYLVPGRSFEAQMRHLAERGEYGPGDADKLVADRLKPIIERQSWQLDRQRPNGTSLYITGTALPSGCYVFTFTDITERVQAAARLEQAVLERTVQYRDAKEHVERALARLNEAHSELRQASHLIDEGVQYASRIQAALLPDLHAHGGLLADVGVIWQPVQALGGDLYWLSRLGDECVVAIMDCTGHGVPGALLSAIAAAGLGNILNQHRERDPAAILRQLNRAVQRALQQDRPGSEFDDGLEAAICVVQPKLGRLRFAGANRPLVLQGAGGPREIKGDRRSIGYRDCDPEFAFTVHDVDLTPETVCYLYTDGVTDQLSAESGRLFGRHRLLDSLRDLDAPSIETRLHGLRTRLDSFRAGGKRVDDMAMIGFRAAL